MKGIKYAFCMILLFPGCFTSDNNERALDENENTLYTLQIPLLNSDPIASGMEIVNCRIVREGQKTFLQEVNPSHLMHMDYRWFADTLLEEQQTEFSTGCSNMWKISFAQDKKKIDIFGYKYGDWVVKKYELSGYQKALGHWEGEGLVSFMGEDDTVNKAYYQILKIKWRLFDSSLALEDDERLKQTELTRELPASNIPVITEEEAKANEELFERVSLHIPPVKKNSFRTPMSSPENQRLERAFGNGSDDKPRRLYVRDKILPDIEWSEMLALPESLFMVDHLATVEELDVRYYIVQGQCVDGSGLPLIGQDLTLWTKAPLVFLLVHYTDWLTSERMEALEKTTERMRLLMDEIKKYGKESPSHLDEIMESVLRQMPEKERFDYFAKCVRLRNYVKESNNDALRNLVPENLPPPPGPPENMRNWTANGQTYVGAFISVNERRTLVRVMDEDGEESRFIFSDLSDEDQEYVQSILEKETEAQSDTEDAGTEL